MRITFPILSEDESGNLIFDREVDVSTLTVYKDSTLMSSQPTIYNNGDGTYYFEFTESGTYGVKINGVIQSEFWDIPVCSTTDTLSDSVNLDPSPSKGKIQKDGSDYLELYNGDTVLHEADVVDDDTTGGSDVPASAEIVKTLGEEIDALDVPTVYRRRNIYCQINEAATAAGETAGAIASWQETSTSYVNKIKFNYIKQSNDEKVIINFYGRSDTAAGSLQIDVSGYNEEQAIAVNGTFLGYEVEVDISALTTKAMVEIDVDIKAGSGGTTYLKLVVIDIE